MLLELNFCIIALSSAISQVNTDFFSFACFCTIDHAQSYKGRIFSQWLAQIAMIEDRTCYPQMRELVLGPRSRTGIAYLPLATWGMYVM